MIFGKRAELLALGETEPGNFRWELFKTLWVKAEDHAKTNLFSKVGIGVKTTLFTLRKTEGITLHHAIRMDNGFYFLTGIEADDPVTVTLTAALIRPVACRAFHVKNKKDGLNRPVGGPPVITLFPGCLTEKYMGWTQEKPMAQSETRLVLVTPKAIKLAVGDLVEIDGEKYAARIAHELDEFKNEYEIALKRDVSQCK